MDDQSPNRLSHIRHELVDIIGGLTSAKDLLKSLPGAATIETIVHLSHSKVKDVITLVDKTRTDLVGSYILESCEIKRPGSVHFSAWGKNIHGHLMYSNEGTVSVSINREGIASDDSLLYAGTYETVGCGELRHHIAECSDRSRIGKTKHLTYEFRGGNLYMLVRADHGDIKFLWNRV